MLKRVLIAVAALVGVAVTLSLGVWQWGRAQQKIDLHEAIVRRAALPPLDNAQLARALRGDTGELLHRRVALRGEWVARHTVYLDNRPLNGRAGFYVVTPLKLADGGPTLLVTRGWAPRDFVQRDRLPAVDIPAGTVALEGRLALTPSKLYDFQGAETGAIRQNLDLERFRAETGLDLPALAALQTGAASEGLLREWPQPASGADKNYGYAFQWWALAALIAILYVWFQLIVPHRKARQPG
ncbi:SURF1 family protein [Ramlibacter sp.]|uniref:SURF1 family protein n=1 Tax=Ramlibacter sp. TaxID=1917967 RepID=UPI0035B0B7C2